ncbi:MAG: penicillin-binding protein activator LpoB [Elusimicrobiales bacterium]
MKKAYLIPAACALALACGCGTSVQRMDANEVKDVSGAWNDTDSRLTAEEMMADCLSRPWYDNAKAQLGKTPVVVVGTVGNQSMEHINTGTFVENLQRALINSGKVNFVAGKAERTDIRQERLDQDTNASDATRKEHGQETGADYMLTGVLNSINDREGGKEIVFYQTNLKLIDVKTSQIVWNGEKKLKKYVKRAKHSW